MPQTSALASSSPTELVADGFADADFSRRRPRECRAKSMTDLMHDRALQIAFAADFGGLRRLHQLAGDWQDHVVHACVHEVLEEEFLAAFLLVYSRIVWKIVGHGLISVRQIARAEGCVHHFHRRLQTALRGPVFGSERKGVLNIGYIFLKQVQLLALALVPYHDSRSIGTFHAEQAVHVGFIRRKDNVELRILQVKPCQIARKVIVTEERIGSQFEKLRECRVIT